MNFFTALDYILKSNSKAINNSFVTQIPALHNNHDIVLFGAGPLGQITLDALRRINILPIAFADNNIATWGKTINGVPVLSAAEAIAQHVDATFVVTIYNPSKAINQLQQAGCKYVTGAAALWRAHPQMGTHGSFGTSAPIFDRAQDVRQALELFADKESQREYVAQLQWRTVPNFNDMPPQRSGTEIYFPPEIALSAEDAFVDCGAFDGDTLRMLLAKQENSFSHFIGFEPDPNNFARLQKFTDTLPTNIKSKIELHNAAVGAHNETVRFRAMGTAGSGINGAGEIEMSCIRLDDTLAHSNPSFIKMDIEGAELDALTGARETILRSRPILAVCTYHEMDHLWRIPQMIHNIVPDYKIYLRRYAEECWELVVYGVPSER